MHFLLFMLFPQICVLFPEDSQEWECWATKQVDGHSSSRGCLPDPGTTPEQKPSFQGDSKGRSWNALRGHGPWWGATPVSYREQRRSFFITKTLLWDIPHHHTAFWSIWNLVKVHLMAFPRMLHPLGWASIPFHRQWVSSLFTQMLLYLWIWPESQWWALQSAHDSLPAPAASPASHNRRLGSMNPTQWRGLAGPRAQCSSCLFAILIGQVGDHAPVLAH